MKKALALFKKDRILSKILNNPITIPHYDGNVREYLYSSIISQQLSTKSAEAIYNRFLNHYDGASPSSSELLNTNDETLRSLGLSYSKTKYLKNVAQFFSENDLDVAYWHDKTDEEIINLLTSIKGVGVWTVQMVLIFCLARQDVFPILDLAIRQSAIELSGLSGDKKMMNKELLKIAEQWKPYRSIASLYLWSWRNNKL